MRRKHKEAAPTESVPLRITLDVEESRAYFDWRVAARNLAERMFAVKQCAAEANVATRTMLDAKTPSEITASHAEANNAFRNLKLAEDAIAGATESWKRALSVLSNIAAPPPS
jgi:hypothetical protein